MDVIIMENCYASDEGFAEQYVARMNGHEFLIPRYMGAVIRRYVEQGIEPGSFLSAIICNDLVSAVCQADSENIVNIPAYVNYFYNEVTSQAWGSKEKMDAWIECHRLIRESKIKENADGIEN